MTTYVLTPGQDLITGAANTDDTFVAILSSVLDNQANPTLNSGDILAGGVNSNNLLDISDDYGLGEDILPEGTQLSNIQMVELRTANNAGGGQGGPDAIGGTFSTGGITGDALDLVLSSGNGNDNVTAAASTTIEVSHSGVGNGEVTTNGGQNIGIVTFGTNGVIVNKPTGSVVVQDNGGGEDDVNGGGNVTIYANQSGPNASVLIGVATIFVDNAHGTLSLAAPAGQICVAAAAGDFVDIGGGTSVGVSALGATTRIGVDGSSPSGDVVVNNFATTTYSGSFDGLSDEFVAINGGVNVTVSTNAGSVYVQNSLNNVSVAEGSAAATVQIGTSDTADYSEHTLPLRSAGVNVGVVSLGSTIDVGNDGGAGAVVAPTGAVAIVDVGAIAYDGIADTSNNEVSVIGGTSISVSTNAGSVAVGGNTGDAGANPTGNVAIADTATGLASNSLISGEASGAPVDAVDVFGGANVTVLASGGNLQIGGGTAVSDATGSVTVYDAAVETGGLWSSHIEVYGGNGVTVGVTGALVTVGEIGAAASGAINIADVFSGPSIDGFAVIGGNTVNISTTPLIEAQNTASMANGAVSGSITVGETPLLAASGSALSNAADYATGNVTVVNAEAFSSGAYLGAGTTTIYTNGAQAVSVTGGAGATITDVETTHGIGGAIGTSTLSSVTLNGVEDNVSITSDALSSLSVSNTGIVDGAHNVTSFGGVDERAPTLIAVNETPAHTLALALSNDVNLSLQDRTATAVAITTTGADPLVGGVVVVGGSDLVLSAPNATTLSLAGAGDITLDAGSGLSTVSTITASGSGAVSLGDFAGSTHQTSINASAASGGVSVEILPSQTTFVGGSGNDVVTIDSDNFLNVGTVNGGLGNNTLVANFATNTANAPLAAYTQNFQTLELGANSYSATPSFGFDGSGFASFIVDSQYTSSGHATTIYNASPDTNITFAASNAVLVYNLNQTAVTTGNNNLTINEQGYNSDYLDISGAFSATTTAATVGNGITSLAINSMVNPDNATAVSSLTISDKPLSGASVSAITIAGAGGLILQLQSNSPVYDANAGNLESIKTIDTSGSSGAINVSALAGEDALSLSGVIITGGGGVLSAAGVNDLVGIGSVSGANDLLTTGSGGGNLTFGFGGEWTNGTYGVGSETVNLSASAANVDTLNVVTSARGQGAISSFNGTSGGVTGFKVTSTNTTSDRLNFSTQQAVIANFTTAVAVTSIAGGSILPAPVDLTYTTSNGVITFSATTDTNVDASFTQAQLVAAAEIIVDHAGPNTVAEFQSLGNTYVVSSGADTPVTAVQNTNSAVQLLGVTGIQGFGSTETGGGAVAGTAAANTILADVIQVHDAVTGPGPVNAAGFSDVLISGATGTTIITGLGAAGQIDISSAMTGPITVTQVGAAGADSLVINFENSSTIAGLTLHSDNTVTINGSGTDIISAIVDGSGALATIDITGAGRVTLSSFTTPGLQTIDASSNIGGLTVGTAGAPLTPSNLHITGGNGADTFFVNGSNLMIDDHLASSTTLSASGSGDFITARALQGTGTAADNFITGAAVISGNNETIAFTSGNLIAKGSNDHIAILGSGNVSVGANATVAVSNVGIDQISATDDVTGATSSGSFAYTTITTPVTPLTGAGATHAAIDPSQLLIHFNNAVTESSAVSGGSFSASLVNVAGAASLGSAIDIAAHQNLILNYQGGGTDTMVKAGVLQENAETGLADWFQYGGNTYVVESINKGPAAAGHDGLSVGDVVIKLAGLVDLSGDAFSAHALHR